jgi:hypothetical protein
MFVVAGNYNLFSKLRIMCNLSGVSVVLRLCASSLVDEGMLRGLFVLEKVGLCDTANFFWTCCRVTFAPGQVDGICVHDGHPVRKFKYKTPAKLNVGNPYENFGWKTVAPSRLKFTKQDAREMEQLLGGPNDTYAPSVARMKRR